MGRYPAPAAQDDFLQLHPVAYLYAFPKDAFGDSAVGPHPALGPEHGIRQDPGAFAHDAALFQDGGPLKNSPLPDFDSPPQMDFFLFRSELPGNPEGSVQDVPMGGQVFAGCADVLPITF